MQIFTVRYDLSVFFSYSLNQITSENPSFVEVQYVIIILENIIEF